MDDNSRVLIISEDTFLKGEIRNGGRIEVFGYVEGEIAGDLLIVQPGGRCFGKVKVDTADVRGQLQGDILVRQLITIRGTGEVTGNVKYGKLAMEIGGMLTAEMRNMPPSIAGDLDLSVDMGKAVRITLQDLIGARSRRYGRGADLYGVAGAQRLRDAGDRSGAPGGSLHAGRPRAGHGAVPP